LLDNNNKQIKDF